MVHLQQKSHALIALLLAACTLWCAQTASARQGIVDQWLEDTRSSIDVRIELGWDNKPIAGRWNPLRLRLKSDTLIGGVITVEYNSYDVDPYRMHSTYAITPGTEAIVDLVIPIGQWHRTFMVTLRNQRNRVVARFEFKNMSSTFSLPISASANTPLVASPAALTTTTKAPLLPDSGERDPDNDVMVQHAAFDAAILPTSHHAYDSLTVLVLDSRSCLEASQATIQAIRLWMDQGGRVVLVLDKPGNSHERIVSREILTAGESHVDSSGTIIRSIQLTQAARHQGWALKTGESAMSVPIADGPVGLGWVTVLGANPVPASQREQASEYWDPVLAPLLSDVLLQQTEQNEQYRWSNQSFGIGSMLNVVASMIDGVGNITIWPVFLALLFLAAALGPIDWFVLKKSKFQHLSWLTASAWIVGLSVLAYVASRVLQSGESQLRSVAIVDMVQGESLGQETRIDGIFSATSQRITLKQTGQNARVRPISRNVSFKDFIDMGSLPGTRFIGASTFRMSTMSYRSMLTEHTIAAPAMTATVQSGNPERVALSGLSSDAHIDFAWLQIRGETLVLSDWQFVDGAWISTASKPAPPRNEPGDSYWWGAQSLREILSKNIPLPPGANARSWSMERRADRQSWALVGVVLNDMSTGNPLPTIADTKQTTVLRILTPLDQPTDSTQ